MITTELFQPEPPATADVERLEQWLFGFGDWITASGICQYLDNLSDRKIRNLASELVLIISGQHGYKHIKHATIEEIGHAANWLESQAKKMSDLACAIRKQGHRLL